MISFAQGRSAYMPPLPEKVEDLGIPYSLLVDLILRRTFITGISTFESLSQTLKLPYNIIEHVFRDLRQQQLLDVKGMIGNDYNFGLTTAGRNLASERFQISQYAGPAPVGIKQYHKAVKAQAARVKVDRKVLRQAFSDLVLSERILDQIGPAIISQNAMFLYGPTGNGKTSVAERLLRVYQDAILVPYAVEVDSQIIQVYDPVVHEGLPMADQEDADRRWVLCRRPSVITGGELVQSMLELRLDEASGIYAAPLQMKANNGVLVIDDFGRQQMAPRDLLNRWMVPLDRRVDYISLKYGVKFQIPFEMQVVFSTNLEPRDLADEAFLRRLHNKIFIEPVDAEIFDEIFRRVVTARSLPVEPDSAEFLRNLCLARGSSELHACFPADICNILVAISVYEGRPPRVTRQDLERSVALYFAHN